MTDEPIWLDPALIEAVHDRLLVEHGGASGVRDRGLLASAMNRPRHLAAYGDPDLCALAAAYVGGILRNHPFVDGNKRTAFMGAFIFLARNGLTLSAPESEATQAMVWLTAGDLTEEEFASWLRIWTE